ncbi:MAG: SuhR protein [Actinomycetota bacterium]
MGSVGLGCGLVRGETLPEKRELENNKHYKDPKLTCDVVMKGGITSGVTYPHAVCEIARTYRLRNVGGTSAGAIASAASAAAELGRKNGGGFARLASLPRRLSEKAPCSKDPLLLSLFQPSPKTRPIFRMLRISLDVKGQPLRLARKVIAAAYASAPLASLLGALLGLSAVALLIATDRAHDDLRSNAVAVAALSLGSLASFLLAVLGSLTAAAVTLIRRAMRDLPNNGFGLCSGYLPDPDLSRGTAEARLEADLAEPKPLTTWLADELDALAGTGPDPLTLGDLARGGINLRMFTTNLSLGTPYSLPFRDRNFYFCPKEFRGLFPERVVSWMESHSRTPREGEVGTELALMADEGLLPLPEPRNMPVVVMTRLSLSFPLLLSAVPLWELRWSKDSDEAMTPQKCWFSDGGITSNFPIHFFDGPLPRWPTFAINLGPTKKLDPDPSKNIWAPLDDLQGVPARWKDIRSMPGFLHSIVDTMQNWSDNSQVRVPGYRDRIVTILHTTSEGGMNLNMDQETIDRFSYRGQLAGRFLVNRFSGAESTNPNDKLNWKGHRWLRYRSLMPLIEEMMAQYVKGYNWPPYPDSAGSYRDLVLNGPGSSSQYQWWNDKQSAVAQKVTKELIKLTGKWMARPTPPDPTPPKLPPPDLDIPPDGDVWNRSRPLAAGAPKPRPALRIVRDA